jgi:hypothetical protein
MKYLQDEYQYRVTKSAVEFVRPMVWYELDQKRVPPSPLERLTSGQSMPKTPSPGPEGNIDSFFQNKVAEDQFGLELITSQIQYRDHLKTRHLEELDQAISYCKYKIWLFSESFTGSNRSVDQTRNSFAQQIFQLEHQRRQEENASWKDTTGLLKDALEGWTAYRGDLWTYSVLNQN